eukprot:31097_1
MVTVLSSHTLNCWRYQCRFNDIHSPIFCWFKSTYKVTGSCLVDYFLAVSLAHVASNVMYNDRMSVHNSISFAREIFEERVHLLSFHSLDQGQSSCCFQMHFMIVIQEMIFHRIRLLLRAFCIIFFIKSSSYFFWIAFGDA